MKNKVNKKSTRGGGYQNLYSLNKKYIYKVILSLIFAFLILNTFCLIYYNIPIHDNCRDGSTDYKWKSSRFYSRLTEGFAYGKINNDGYSNVFDYDSNNNDIDILLMGSSHMESFNVNMNKSTAFLLNNYFNKNRVYNIGISGHRFLSSIKNLENAIKKYNPKYVIIEASNITFSNDDLSNLLNNKYKKIPSNSSGIIGLLQRVQVFRLLYKQYKGITNNEEKDIDIEDEIQYNVDSLNKELMEKLFSKIHNILVLYDVKLIIMYNPSTILNSDGSLKLSSEKEDVEGFKQLCQKNDIYFLDMSDRFREEYENNYVLPYGFSNTSVGYGHLNKYGHEMIADELYKLIKEVE